MRAVQQMRKADFDGRRAGGTGPSWRTQGLFGFIVAGRGEAGGCG